MILDFFEGKLNGDSWEDICQSCYRMMYRNVHYTENAICCVYKRKTTRPCHFLT